MPRTLLILASLAAALSACGSSGSDQITPSAAASSAPASATTSSTGAAGSSSCPAGAPASTDDFNAKVTLVDGPNGLRYGDFVVGTGPQPQRGRTVTVQYTGWLSNGCVFDTSRQPGRGPFSFPIDTGKVIPGWDEGVLTMHVGGKRRLVIPPQLGYGSLGYPPVIPGNATLVFDVELLGVS